MPVFRAKILVPKYVAVEAESLDEAAPLLKKHAELQQGVLLVIETLPPRDPEPAAMPAGDAA